MTHAELLKELADLDAQIKELQARQRHLVLAGQQRGLLHEYRVVTEKHK